MANVNTRIKIVSDSTCNLSDELLSMYDITILPMHVLKGGISYLDGIEISTWNVFEHVNSGGEICTTSAINIAEFQEYLNEVSSQYSAVIILTIDATKLKIAHSELTRQLRQYYKNIYNNPAQ